MVAASAAIVLPLWLVATRMRSLYNILLVASLAIGVGATIVRRIHLRAEETDLRTALAATAFAAARLIAWVATLAAAPLFVLALFSTGAYIAAIAVIVVDLGAIGFLLTSGRRAPVDRRG